MAAPTTTCPDRESSGSDPGAAMSARAVRTWWCHCRASNAAGLSGVRPPAPVRMRNLRYAHAAPPAAMPSGTAGAATATAAATGCPCARSCHIAAQARYGAAAARSHQAPAPTPAAAPARPAPAPPAGRAVPGHQATAPSHAITIGRHHAAAAYTRRGGWPRHHAYQNAAAATSVTGANATASRVTMTSRTSRRNPPQSAARTGR